MSERALLYPWPRWTLVGLGGGMILVEPCAGSFAVGFHLLGLRAPLGWPGGQTPPAPRTPQMGRFARCCSSSLALRVGIIDEGPNVKGPPARMQERQQPLQPW